MLRVNKKRSKKNPLVMTRKRKLESSLRLALIIELSISGQPLSRLSLGSAQVYANCSASS